MTSSLFSSIPTAAPDAILGMTDAFKNDPAPIKANLGVGVYQDGEGKIPMLRSLQRAAEIWAKQEDSKTYLPIDGVPAYNAATQEVVFGKECSALKDKRVATIQTVGGSGALKIGIDFIKKFSPTSSIYISDPSWENHRVIFEAAGLAVHTYPYYDPKTNGLRKEAMLETLRGLSPRTAVLLHACCHNPTGVDLDKETWEEVAQICSERDLIPFLDCAYQGFAEGLELDAYPIRLMAEKGLNFLVSSSYSKSFSIYRERVGALSFVTNSAKEAAAVISQLKRIVRTLYSSPPSYGGQLVALALTTPELKSLWTQELEEMRVRISDMRSLFVQKLKEAVPQRDFSFVLKQRGMFSYSGLAVEQMQDLREQFHVYGLDSGRICVAAINAKNVDYICDSIAKVVAGK